MKVIIKEPGQRPRVTEIENSLSALQEAVGGYIETVTFAEDCCIICCNEEGRLQELPYNLTFCGVSFVGTILFVGVLGGRVCRSEQGVCGDTFRTVGEE